MKAQLAQAILWVAAGTVAGAQTPSSPTPNSIAATSQTPPASTSQKKDRLQDRSRLEIVRYVSGEFAKAVKALPGGKGGFRFSVGKPFDENAHRQAVGRNGAAASPGDQVQITQLTFKEKEIQLDINGGGKRKTRLRDRIQISVGGVPTVSGAPAPSQQGYLGAGATLILDFGRPLPDMTPDELKQILAPLLDFSRQRSAAVDWVSTLEPQFQEAIKERRAVVGMDREMVIAALGRPERKVRERNDDGIETEDWIYGDPPGKTIFITFAGEKVIRVKEFPR